MSATTNKRRGLRKLQCDCGAAVYATWAQVERHGVPSCGCGGRFLPDDVELAMACGLEDAPAVVEYMRELASVEHGQAGPARSMRGNGGTHFRKPQLIAAERVEKRRREQARANRLNALRPAAEPMPF